MEICGLERSSQLFTGGLDVPALVSIFAAFGIVGLVPGDGFEEAVDGELKEQEEAGGRVGEEIVRESRVSFSEQMTQW